MTVSELIAILLTMPGDAIATMPDGSDVSAAEYDKTSNLVYICDADNESC